MASPEFLNGLAGHGAAPALISADGRAISYADLARRSAAFAAQLGPDRTLVAIEAAPSEHAVIGLIGALRAGHVVALLPPDAEARAAFAARFAPEHVWREAEGRWRLSRSAAPPEAPMHPDLALLLLTSGTTGGPRAVRLSGAALHANAVAIADFLGLRAADRAGLVLPLHYSYGLSVLTSHLAVGASVWLGAGSILDAGFVEGMQERRCTSLAGVPYSYELLERIGFRAAALPDVRMMTVAGGRLDPDRLRLYAAHMRETRGRFFAMYGQTEATARIAYLPPELAERRAECIGVAIPGGTLGLVDADGSEILGAGAAGELVYRGANVMMGYAETRADLARGAELAALATGDVAVREPDGLFRIVGRKARMSKIAGLRISHDALEAALAAEGVAAAVVGDDAELVAAFEGSASESEVRARLAAAARLPLSLVRAMAVSQLPRLASGKPDYAAVRAQAGGGARAERADPEIAEAFREVFHPRQVGPNDSFARLGGDSLRHVELALALERRLGHLPSGWEAMRVADLSGRAGGRADAGGARVGSDILLRALAILLVVIHHATLWPIPVGSATMLVLVGFGLARFQLAALAEGGVAGFVRPLAAVLVPYYAIVAGYALAWGQVPWASVFLVGNFGLADPVRHDMLPYLYWFVEVFAQLMLVLAAAFLVAPVRRFALAAPFRFGLVLLGVALIARGVGPALWQIGGRQIFTLPWVLPLVAFGWCAAAAATGRQRLLVVCLAAATMPALAWNGGNWTGSWVRYGCQFLVVATLLYAPTVRLPARATPAVLSVAAAGYAIYLVHRFAPEALLAPLQASLPPGAFATLSVLGGLALGLLAHRGVGSLKRLARGEAFAPKRALRRSGAGA